MDGYVASARIASCAPRLARARRFPDEAADPSAEPIVEVLIVESEAAVREGPVPLTERWSAFRERWSQLTFFLFDPGSWR